MLKASSKMTRRNALKREQHIAWILYCFLPIRHRFCFAGTTLFTSHNVGEDNKDIVVELELNKIG